MDCLWIQRQGQQDPLMELGMRDGVSEGKLTLEKYARLLAKEPEIESLPSWETLKGIADRFQEAQISTGFCGNRMLSVNDVRYYLQPQMTAAPDPSVWDRNWFPGDKQHPVNLILAVAPVGKLKMTWEVVLGAAALFGVVVGITTINNDFKLIKNSEDLWASLHDFGTTPEQRVRWIRQLGNKNDSKAHKYLNNIFIDRRMGSAEWAAAEVALDDMLAESDLWSLFEKESDNLEKKELLQKISQYPTRVNVEKILSLPDDFEQISDFLPPIRKALFTMTTLNPDVVMDSLIARNDFTRAALVVDNLFVQGRFSDLPREYKHYLSGRFFLLQKEYDKAEDHLNQALKDRQNWPKPLFYLGMLHATKGEDKEASIFFEAARVNGGNWPELFEGAVAEAIRQNDLDSASDLVDRRLSLGSSSTTEDLYYLGLKHMFSKKFPEAKVVYDAILRQNPKDARATYNRALTMMEIYQAGSNWGDPKNQKAIETELQKVVAILSKESGSLDKIGRGILGGAYHTLATLEYKGRLLSHNPKIVESHFKRAIEVYANPKVYNEYGAYLAQLRKEDRPLLEKALQQFDNALQINSNFSLALRNRAILLTRLGRADAEIALISYVENQNFLPKDRSSIASTAAYYYRTQGKLNVAEKWGREAIRLDPMNSYAYEHLGEALVDLGRIDEAKRTYQYVIDHCEEYEKCTPALVHDVQIKINQLKE